MKKKYPIILAFILQSFFTFGQFSVKIINENFNSNMMRWETQKNENAEMSIQDGKYLLTCLKEGTAITSAIQVDHIEDKNFSITASMQKLKGIDDNGYGLLWGSQDANNEYEFIISGNGQFKIIQWANGNKTELVPWTYSSSIKKWDFSTNTLKIQNINRVLRFFINETYVAGLNEVIPFGNRIGFILNESMQVEIDNLIVENLTNVSDNYKSVHSKNLKITKIEYAGSGSVNEIKYNESGTLNIQITNLDNILVNDLILKLEPKEPIYGLEFNPMIMIDKINAGEIKTFNIKFSANEEITDQINNFNIYIQNLDQERIDTKNFNLKTIGISTYYQSNNTNNISTTEKPSNTANDNASNKTNNTTNSNVDGCSKSCAGIGLVSLLTALILALL